MVTPPGSTSVFLRYVKHIETTVNTDDFAVIRNSQIHPKLCHKIGGSEHNEANFKQAATAINELCIPKTVPRGSTELRLYLSLLTSIGNHQLLQKSKNPQIFTESLDSHFFDFLDFHVFFLILCVESKKTLGNVWILLVWLVKIIIFSRAFLDFVTKSKIS